MMAPVASLVLLSVAVSLDGFGVGMTYGVRKIKIPVPSVAIISVCSGLVIFLSMMVGVVLTKWLPPHGASVLGAIILMGIGVMALMQLIRARGKEKTEDDCRREDAQDLAAEPAPVLKLELKLFGFIVQILRTPSAADVDRSGTISSGEAFFLGLALSLDAFGAGIGAALLGFPAEITALLIALSSGLFLWSGTRVGYWASDWRWVKHLSAMPGIILIAMGIFKLFV
ncbi:sporulation membrane protein YtaF [Cohnella suwonensis]|uniref:Sporulation membrane protein YtaF n=1 Tax=Cohnella suwonensis TaxID=696072 RepID=A0ABW0M118_9BACL